MNIVDYVTNVNTFPADLEPSFKREGFEYVDFCPQIQSHHYVDIRPEDKQESPIDLKNKTFFGYGIFGNIKGNNNGMGLVMRVFFQQEINKKEGSFADVLKSLAKKGIEFKLLPTSG